MVRNIFYIDRCAFGFDQQPAKGKFFMKGPLLVIIFLIFLSDICDTISQLVLKSSINSLDWEIDSISKAIRLVFRLGKIPFVWLGLIFSVLSLLIWLFVLTKSDLNFAFSLDSMRYVLIAVASMIFLKEKIGPVRWAGICAVVCGIVLVTIG